MAVSISLVLDGTGAGAHPSSNLTIGCVPIRTRVLVGVGGERGSGEHRYSSQCAPEVAGAVVVRYRGDQRDVVTVLREDGSNQSGTTCTTPDISDVDYRHRRVGAEPGGGPPLMSTSRRTSPTTVILMVDPPSGGSRTVRSRARATSASKARHTAWMAMR